MLCPLHDAEDKEEAELVIRSPKMNQPMVPHGEDSISKRDAAA
jgi:hypothetical protein